MLSCLYALCRLGWDVPLAVADLMDELDELSQAGNAYRCRQLLLEHMPTLDGHWGMDLLQRLLHLMGQQESRGTTQTQQQQQHHHHHQPAAVAVASTGSVPPAAVAAMAAVAPKGSNGVSSGGHCLQYSGTLGSNGVLLSWDAAAADLSVRSEAEVLHLVEALVLGYKQAVVEQMDRHMEQQQQHASTRHSQSINHDSQGVGAADVAARAMRQQQDGRRSRQASEDR